MGKIVLFLVGVALLVTSVHYFVSLDAVTIIAKPSNNTEKLSAQERSVLSVSGAFAADKPVPVSEPIPIVTQEPLANSAALKSPITKPTTPKVTPLKTNSADSLRSALESVVEESIEQELWDEMETEEPQEKN